MSEDNLQASGTPARAALQVPPQPELLAVRNVGEPQVKVTEQRPNGTIQRTIRKRVSQ